jgi:hypothetical protein
MGVRYPIAVGVTKLAPDETEFDASELVPRRGRMNQQRCAPTPTAIAWHRTYQKNQGVVGSSPAGRANIQ